MTQTFKDAKLTYFNQDLQQTSNLVGVFLTTVTITYTAITVDTTQNQTVTLKGLRPTSGAGSPPNINPGDIVLVQPQSTLGVGVSMAGAWVSAANTLSVSLASSATTTTPVAIVFDVLIFKF